MKRLFFLIIFVNSFLSVFSQTSEDYNFKGDSALQKNDFLIARSYYAEGLDSCNLYSIKKLAEIWENQPSEQEGMLRPMRLSFNCLKSRAEEGNSDAMLLLKDFYFKGIGTEMDSVMGNFWLKEYGVALGIQIDLYPYNIDNSIAKKTPRKGFFSNRFHPFFLYSFSPTMPYGLMTGVYYNKFGIYLNGRTNSKSVNAVYECNNSKVPIIEILSPPYSFNRHSWHNRMITGGILYPITKYKFFVTLGGGYAKRDYYREIITDEQFETGNKSEWCYNTQASYKGFTLEAGALYVWKKLIVAGGINSTALKDLDVYIGLGISF